MSSKPSREQPTTPASLWYSWVREHPGLVLTVGSFLFVVVKLLTVSRFNPTVGLALATSAGPGQVFLGLVLLGYPFLLVALALGAIFQFSREVTTEDRRGWRAWPLLLVALASLVFVEMEILAVLLASLVPALLNLLALPRSGTGPSRAIPGAAQLFPAPGDPRISRLQGKLERERDPSERARIEAEIVERQARNERREEQQAQRRARREGLRAWLRRFIPGTRSFLWLPPAVVLLFLTLSPQMWLPAEIVNVRGRKAVAYVVSADGPWTTLFRESDRRVVRVSSVLVTRREICQLDEQTKSPIQLLYRQETLQAPVCFP